MQGLSGMQYVMSVCNVAVGLFMMLRWLSMNQGGGHVGVPGVLFYSDQPCYGSNSLLAYLLALVVCCTTITPTTTISTPTRL
jgi:hypothetical protein